MTVRERNMAKPFKGVVNVDISRSTPDWAPYAQPVARDGAPNILYIVLDDVGFSGDGALRRFDPHSQYQPDR